MEQSPRHLENCQSSCFLISSNQLTGEVPSSLGTIMTEYGRVSLLTLDLSFNQLSGEIPSSLGDLTALFFLDLSFNQLSGSIASSLGRTDLTHLILQNNQLRGSIPSSLGKLSELYTLDLSSNLLGGSIPSLVSLTILNKLFLSNNLLSGPVPELSSSLELCELSNNTDLCGHPVISNLCTVGLETCNMDCRMMNSWLPMMFDNSNCCSQSGIGCFNERITNLYVSFKLTFFKNSGIRALVGDISDKFTLRLSVF
jgi:hypothetical protein